MLSACCLRLAPCSLLLAPCGQLAHWQQIAVAQALADAGEDAADDAALAKKVSSTILIYQSLACISILINRRLSMLSSRSWTGRKRRGTRKRFWRRRELMLRLSPRRNGQRHRLDQSSWSRVVAPNLLLWRRGEDPYHRLVGWEVSERDCLWLQGSECA